MPRLEMQMGNQYSNIPVVHLQESMDQPSFLLRWKKSIAILTVTCVAFMGFFSLNDSISDLPQTPEEPADIEGASYWPRLGLHPVYLFSDNCDPVSSGEWTSTEGNWTDSSLDIIQDDDDGDECVVRNNGPDEGEIWLTEEGMTWDQVDIRFLYLMPCNPTDIVNSIIYVRVPNMSAPDPAMSHSCQVSYNPKTTKFTIGLYQADKKLRSVTRKINTKSYDICRPFTWEVTVGGNEDLLMCALSQIRSGVVQSVASTMTEFDSVHVTGGIGINFDHPLSAFIDLEVLEQSPTMSPTHLPTPGPTSDPTHTPTPLPTSVPTYVPTYAPTSLPTPTPSYVPTYTPSSVPTSLPSPVPSSVPSYKPTPLPSYLPTPTPSSVPSPIPSYVPTPVPTTYAPTSFCTGALAVCLPASAQTNDDDFTFQGHHKIELTKEPSITATDFQNITTMAAEAVIVAYVPWWCWSIIVLLGLAVAVLIFSARIGDKVRSEERFHLLGEKYTEISTKRESYEEALRKANLKAFVPYDLLQETYRVFDDSLKEPYTNEQPLREHPLSLAIQSALESYVHSARR